MAVATQDQLRQQAMARALGVSVNQLGAAQRAGSVNTARAVTPSRTPARAPAPAPARVQTPAPVREAVIPAYRVTGKNQTVNMQAAPYAGRGPGGSDLIGWRNPRTGQTISGNDRGNSAFNEPIWGPPRQAEHGGDEGGGGGDRGDYRAGENFPIFEGLSQGILNDLNAPLFNEDQFNRRSVNLTDDARIKAELLRRAKAEQLSGRGVLGGGIYNEELKNVADLENQTIAENINTLANDERAFLQSQRDRGVASATSLFTTQLNNRTDLNIAEANRQFQERLLASQLAFAEQQNALNRAMERQNINAAVGSARNSGGSAAMNGIAGLLGGLSNIRLN